MAVLYHLLFIGFVDGTVTKVIGGVRIIPIVIEAQYHNYGFCLIGATSLIWL